MTNIHQIHRYWHCTASTQEASPFRHESELCDVACFQLKLSILFMTFVANFFWFLRQKCAVTHISLS